MGANVSSKDPGPCGCCVDASAQQVSTEGDAEVICGPAGGQHPVGSSLDGTDFEWVNFALSHMWSDMDQVANYIVEHHVVPKLRQNLPESIHDVKFSRFTLGTKAPRIGPAKVTALPEGSSRVRILITYRSDMVVELSVATKHGSISVGIKNFMITCEVVLRIRPYIEQSPGQAGVSAYLLDEPDIDFEFGGAMGIVNSFGIKGIVLKTIDSALGSKIVMPNIVTQLIGLRDFKVYPLIFESPEPLGMLRVTIMEVSAIDKGVAPENIRLKKQKSFLHTVAGQVKTTANAAFEWVDDHIGKVVGVNTDPYLRLCIGDQIWKPGLQLHSSFAFTVFDPEQKLHISMWDRDLIGADDLMGRVDPLGMGEAVETSNR